MSLLNSSSERKEVVNQRCFKAQRRLVVFSSYGITDAFPQPQAWGYNDLKSRRHNPRRLVGGRQLHVRLGSRRTPAILRHMTSHIDENIEPWHRLELHLSIVEECIGLTI